MKNAIKITCPADPDVEGTFSEEDILQEIREVCGREAVDGEWIDWTLDHAFAGRSYPAEAVTALSCPAITELKMRLDGRDTVKVERTYL